ncbi:helix-turn-helix domain-containing protein [Nitrospira calida]|jgi:transcriptional regulator with XRE-family HTH domain
MGKRFSTRLKGAREKAGLSQAELGERFHVSQAAVHTWESGSSEPRGDTYDKVLEWIEHSENGQRPPRKATARTKEDIPRGHETSGFGEWLLNERQSRGLSHAKLTDKAGLSSQAVYTIEMGIVRSPWKKTRERLVEALGSVPLPREVAQEIKEESEVQGLGEFSDFSPWDDSMIPEEPCVYVYYDRTERPIYVGQTKNLRRRNKQHQTQDKWFFRRLLERGGYFRVDDDTQRTQLEKVLIKFLGRNSLFNEQGARKDE